VGNFALTLANNWKSRSEETNYCQPSSYLVFFTSSYIAIPRSRTETLWGKDKINVMKSKSFTIKGQKIGMIFHFHSYFYSALEFVIFSIFFFPTLANNWKANFCPASSYLVSGSGSKTVWGQDKVKFTEKQKIS
jgi:hypothetical protein